MAADLLSVKCWSRGFDNGAQVVQIALPLLQQVFTALQVGVELDGFIPGMAIDGVQREAEAGQPVEPAQPTSYR